MGTRVFSEGSRLGNKGDYLPGSPLRSAGARLKGSLSGNFKTQVIYDGTVAKTGLPAELLATEAWLDASGLYRVGLNVGPTVHNIGECSATVYGAALSRDYATNVTAAKVAEAAPLWVTLATLTKGQSAGVSSIFPLWRVVFTASGALPGAIAIHTW